MNITERKNIALVIYADPFHFPPTINAANILAEQGFNVYLIGYDNSDNWSQHLDPKVIPKSLGPVKTGFLSLVQYIRSIIFLRKFLKANNIEWVIGYDAKSVLPVYLAAWKRKTKWIYHQHDFWELPVGWWQKFLWSSERKLAKHADFVSFPQLQRAEYFQQVAGLPTLPIIIFNGPRKQWLDEGCCEDEILSGLRKKFKFLLIYQGGWSTHFKLERLFDAIKVAPDDIGLVMLGEEREQGLRNHYVEYLESHGIRERVYLAEKYIPYEKLTGFTKFCDAAIGKLTGDDDQAPFNDRYLIGAANKITEYIACGLPVILQESAPNKLFLKKYPVGILVETTDRIKFATALTELLRDNNKIESIKFANKKLFLEELNFDHQFQPVLEIIKNRSQN